jgi:hypothetical protein
MLVLIITLVAAGAAAPAVPAARSGPVAVVRQLLEGWRSADFHKASSTLAADFRLLTWGMHGESKRIEQDTLQSLQQSMRGIKPGEWDARIGTPIVHEDATGIATVWAPYTFYTAGRKTSCGIESYTLFRLNEGWRIVEFADTHVSRGEDARCVDRPAVKH